MHAVIAHDPGSASGVGWDWMGREGETGRWGGWGGDRIRWEAGAVVEDELCDRYLFVLLGGGGGGGGV